MWMWTLHHTNELLSKVNVCELIANVKVATIDPLFSAVADLSLSVSDLNDHARVLEQAKLHQLVKTARLCLSALRLQVNFFKIKKNLQTISSILLGTVSGAACLVF